MSEEELDRERTKRGFFLASAAAAAAIALASTTGALFTAIKAGDIGDLTRTRDALIGRADSHQNDIINAKIDLIEGELRRRAAAGAPQTKNAELLQIADQMNKLIARQDRLEKTLTNQPLRALEIPILRRDLDAQDKEVASLTASLQKAQESQWETMKWLIGGLAAAIAALCIPLIARRSLIVPVPRRRFLRRERLRDARSQCHDAAPLA